MPRRRKIREAINHGRTVGGVPVHTFEQAFTAIDENGDGSVSNHEFVHAMHNLGFRLSKAQLENLVSFLDSDESGTIDYTEFASQITRRKFGEPPDGAVQEGMIEVVSARGLKDADGYGADNNGSDPYAEIWYNDVRIGTTKVVNDSCSPVWLERFPVPVRPTKMNELRVELYDHDDDPVDETPDFLGQVVMRGHGRDGLPDVAVEYRLAKKMALPPGAETGVSNWRARFEVEESELEVAEKAGKNARRLAAYNEMVGGWITLKFTSKFEAERVAAVAAVTDPSIQDCIATPHIETTLDCSFCNLQRWMGRKGLDKASMAAFLRERGEKAWELADVSGERGAKYGAAAAVKQAKREGKPSPFPVGRRPTFSLHRKLNLARNGLRSLEGVMPALAHVLPFGSGFAIHTVDLSFNELSELDAGFLQQISQCVSLALHGNPGIVSWGELRKLEILKRLQKLTLHGGSLDQQPHYRQRMVGMLPSLRQLDYVAVTPGDRESAAEFRRHPTYEGKGWRSHVTRDRNRDIARSGNVPGHPPLGQRYTSKLSRDEREACYSRLSKPLGQDVDWASMGLDTQTFMNDSRQRRSLSAMA